jgi:hypothetical protein
MQCSPYWHAVEANDEEEVGVEVKLKKNMSLQVDVRQTTRAALGQRWHAV